MKLSATFWSIIY